jgi:thioredoxin 1
MPNAMKKALAAVVVVLAGISALAQDRNVYSDTADPHADIVQAIHSATQTHKRIILDFGGNWCSECLVLNYYLHQQPNLPLLENNFVLVHINIGHMDKNNDVAEKYEVPIKRGVPALAILDEHGRLIYSQKNKEGEALVRTDPASITEFLNQWKPKRKSSPAAH